MQQKRHITRPIRITIMMLLIAQFFVIAPLVVLYTAGYRYNFETKQIMQTGVLTIDIEQKNANVFLNDDQVHQSMPVKIDNLSPEIYKVSISQENYLDWTKNVLVNKKETTYISDFSLIKKDNLVDKQALALNKIVDVTYSFDGQYLLLVKQIQSQVYEFSLLDINSDIQIDPVMRTISDFSPTISWAPSSNSFAIQTSLHNKTSIKVIDAKDKTKSNTISFNTSNKTNTYWSDDALFVGDGKTISKITPLKTNTIGFTSSSTWFVDKKNAIWILKDGRLINKNKEITLNTNIKEILFIQDDIVFAKTSDEIILIDPQNENPIIEKIPTTNIRYNNISEQWISWSPYEIWTINKDHSSNFVNRFGKKIFDVDILDEFGTFAISFEEEIIAYYPKYNVSIPMFTSPSAIFAAYEPTKTLLFLDSKGNKQRLVQYGY